MILSELLYKLVLFCDIVRVGKNSYCEFDKFEFGGGFVMENKCEKCGGELIKGQMVGMHGMFFIQKGK
ncbi:MAG: hypothetical protein ACI4S1_15940 [Roseburia sp.]